MTRNGISVFAGLLLVIGHVAGTAAAQSDSTATAVAGVDSAAAVAGDAEADTPGNGRTYLVPSLQGTGYSVTNDRAKYKNRIWFAPAMGQLGSQDVFNFRVGYAPNTWLGYEVSFEHNPAQSLHATLHTFNVILRYPIPWRAQPYVTLGYGMMTVYPGQAINADPVSKNSLTAGGGMEFYIRDDVAIRGEMRSATILGSERGQSGTVNYQYMEWTVGFSFFRSLGK